MFNYSKIREKIYFSRLKCFIKIQVENDNSTFFLTQIYVTPINLWPNKISHSKYDETKNFHSF